MRLNPNINPTEFIKAVQTCKQDVFYTPPEGGRLNLRSALSQFLFAAVQGAKANRNDGIIECQNADDMKLLCGFAMEE